ncbi:hypothetical protein [Limnofasciculus baicalensis]|uniref:Uncharacterized protein n=1 Tax=Limnofasciculus baicalensis BBK-W-15 TaxID=2699891 RepID=A0AAE3KNU9_9CYAN|nr:hypothetical protein [Limnofasciculus baicalensis]MCP2730694.1 hypothetical protein [Limnofasciculus baicalensis BBK-W-15]
MAKYPNHQLEAATNLLKSFGIAEPYTLEDKIEAINAVSALKSGKVEKIFKNTSSLKYKVSYNIEMDYSKQQLSAPGKLFLVDWRDDLDNPIWI